MLDAPLPTDLRELLEEGGSALTEVDLGWHLVHRKIMPGCRIIETWLNQEGDRLTCERMEAHLCISLNGQSLMCS